jgi:hypothetical protein
MKVFVVERGEFGEGSSILGISASITGAINIAELEFDSWSWNDKKRVSETSWKGGCDYIDITEIEVVE